MSDFDSDLTRFLGTLVQRERAVFANVASAVQNSVVNGSPITGAPGQPVDTGTLKASWHLGFNSPTEAEISTNIVYAPGIEEGVGPHGPIQLRSQVGGFHSVAMTVAGFQRLVEDETAKVAG